MQAILEAAGSSLQHVLRCGVFLVDMSEFQKMNAVYSRMFGVTGPHERPCRSPDCQAPGCASRSTR